MHITSFAKGDLHREVMIILDRDNTLCVDFHNMSGETECILLPGVIEGLKQLLAINPILAIATNQSCVGYKRLAISDVENFNSKLLSNLSMHGISIDLIAICPHIPVDQCDCRKPKPGMLLELMHISGHTRKDKVFFLGDNVTDIQAANAAGIQGLLVGNSNFLELCIAVKNTIKNSTL